MTDFCSCAGEGRFTLGDAERNCLECGKPMRPPNREERRASDRKQRRFNKRYRRSVTQK